ncbi:DUF58 domain-containing protein [Altericroceibacterium xinjiangense]|uniref:DUF58 domain-containing protein n=1 Tax=Altericroceibacterium xinjiangense TaxID=762261 RepID=UPI000F7FA5EF|nr:DUF58 domain-containing protein [Altericroceibacterium xinjiangense]
MIYPTRKAVLAAAAGAPVALVVTAVLPARWELGFAMPLTVLLLCMIDAIQAPRNITGRISLPERAYVGEVREATLVVESSVGRPPSAVEAALSPSPLVTADNDGRLLIRLEDGRGAAGLPLTMARRGLAYFDRLWLRWKSPLGLVWRQTVHDMDKSIAILPDARLAHSKGAAIFQRHALQGLVAQLERGDGSDFDALVEFQHGMDRRTIDWKQSARHVKLHARRYRSERNNQVIFAIDSGRQMSEPVGGLPRVDRAVSAMLLTAWVALKTGDRVALYSFDSRPRIASGTVSGTAAFRQLEDIAAGIDYSGHETNYAFALTTLAKRLTRRSMIVLFTEFTDSISADFLVRAARLAVETHLLLVIVLRDEELESAAAREPQSPEDVTRTVTAAALLKQRRTVLGRLQHLGVHVIESEYDCVGERLVEGYIDLKRRNLL